MVDVSITSRAKKNGIRRPRIRCASYQVAGNNPLCMSVNSHEIEHLVSGMHIHLTRRNLPAQSAVSAKQELLAGLTASIKSATDLGPAKGAIGKQSTILTGKGNALGYALVDNIGAYLGKAVDVRLAGTKVPTLDSIVEKTMDAIPVVLVILGSIDPPLSGNGVCPSSRILVTKAIHVVPQLAQGSRGCPPGQTGSNDNNAIFPFVGRIDQLGRKAVIVPLLSQRTFGYFRIKVHLIGVLGRYCLGKAEKLWIKERGQKE
jgi:hypothetical protein